MNSKIWKLFIFIYTSQTSVFIDNSFFLNVYFYVFSGVSTFWITHPANNVTNNAAGGSVVSTTQ